LQEAALLRFLEERQQRGEIPATASPQTIAQFLNCVIQGMSVSAREGASQEKLLQITRTTLALWPELIKS